MEGFPSKSFFTYLSVTLSLFDYMWRKNMLNTQKVLNSYQKTIIIIVRNFHSSFYFILFRQKLTSLFFAVLATFLFISFLFTHFLGLFSYMLAIYLEIKHFLLLLFYTHFFVYIHSYIHICVNVMCFISTFIDFINESCALAFLFISVFFLLFIVGFL